MLVLLSRVASVEWQVSCSCLSISRTPWQASRMPTASGLSGFAPAWSRHQGTGACRMTERGPLGVVPDRAQMDLSHLRRESRTALELAVIAMAPSALVDRLAAVADLLHEHTRREVFGHLNDPRLLAAARPIASA